MTNATHTPGPWAFTADMYGLDNMRVFGVNDATGNGIANCGYDGRGECKANARLVAAAPDLLETLETLLEGTCEALSFLDRETVKHLKPLIDNAEAAIAKAKGE